MRFLPKGLNPFKIQSRFNLVFNSEFYNSNYREILEMDQKGKLCNLKLSISMPSLDNFGQKEGCILYFQTWSFEANWKIIRNFERNLTGPAQVNSWTSAAPIRPTRPTRPIFPARATLSTRPTARGITPVSKPTMGRRADQASCCYSGHAPL
jgi:hypothetical protein